METSEQFRNFNSNFCDIIIDHVQYVCVCEPQHSYIMINTLFTFLGGQISPIDFKLCVMKRKS